MCIAKGFTAGILPMGATLATARVYDGFSGGPSRALMHGHTFCGHPLGAAVAREAKEVVQRAPLSGLVVGTYLQRDASLDKKIDELGHRKEALSGVVTSACLRGGVHRRDKVHGSLREPLDALD